MNPFSWESRLLPLGVTVMLGAIALYKFKKSQSRTGSSPVVLCHSVLLCLWGIYCFSSFSIFWGWTLFSLACCISLSYSTSQEMLPLDKRAVLITGGDSGIGHALSKYLDELGFTVFVGVLNEKGPGAEALKKTCSKRTSVFQMDITKPAQIREVQARVAEKVQQTGLWAIVNNAGILGSIGDGELLPMDVYRQCMDVNFFGAVEVTKAFMPLLRKSKGRVVNVSSLAGAMPMKFLAAYCASKAALTMFSAVMRMELEKWGIKVVIIHPAGFKTNIFGTKETLGMQEKNILDNISPDVLEAYGQDYIHSSIWPFLQTSEKCTTDFSPIFTDILNGILCKNPSFLYTAGMFSYLCHCLIFYFPVSVFDYASKKMFPTKTLPKALT
ncbi:17-beta-hydroxysteroid dehydrogenase type 2 [Monodelphis domestica]|uniref:17-beta-hydroxysteroid dehydrogenase type 2 n=1 Tax=Monodelphis domestica TaxID=13616 RepID=UPI0024E1D677|nr:17-beta-hydroxysteroid dehydrogenase type 2 [Monodelphis domestica]